MPNLDWAHHGSAKEVLKMEITKPQRGTKIVQMVVTVIEMLLAMLPGGGLLVHGGGLLNHTDK